MKFLIPVDAELPMVSAKEDPNFINTAVFYSITSTQRGLTVNQNKLTSQIKYSSFIGIYYYRIGIVNYL